MLKASTARGAALLGVALTSACSGGGGGNPPPTFGPPPVISYSHTFPAGDANAAQGIPWDIISLTTTLSGQNPGGNGQSYDTLRVDVTFAQDVSNALPAPGTSLLQPAQLGISIGFNTDAKRNTGLYSYCSGASGDRPFEYASDETARIVDGNYAILGAGGRPIYSGSPDAQEEAVTAVSGHTVSQTYILGVLGINAGSAVPHIGVAAFAANGSGGTDCVPGSKTEIYTDSPSLAP